MDGTREIPGYYYDQEKKKYFKIQPSSSGPASSAYSSRDVKRRKTRDEKKAAKAFGIAQQKGRIKPSRVLETTLAGGFLLREQGNGNLDFAPAFARGLVSQGCITTMNGFPNSGGLFAISPRPDLGTGIVDTRIVWNDEFLTLRANTDKYTRTNNREIVEICHDFTAHTVRNSSYTHWAFGNPGTATSLSLNEASHKIAMTWMSGTVQNGIAIVPMINRASDDEGFERPHIIVGPGSSRGPEVDILSSAAAPPQSSLLFAFGTSHGIMTMGKEDFETYFISPRGDAHGPGPDPKDVFALEFLTDNHSILLSGGRSGLLNITDLRIPKFRADADIITHPSSVIHIKQLDTHRIIVAGLNSHLSQYDLRFRKMTTAVPQPSAGRRRLAIENGTTTRPIVQYPDYHNTASIDVGFDVDTETGVVASGQEHDGGENHQAIQLFSLNNGHRLPSPSLAMSTLKEDCPPPRCVRFVRDSESKMKSLYVMNTNIQRYAWVPEEDADPHPRSAYSNSYAS